MGKKSNNIAYVVWLENVNSVIIRTQVIDLIKKIKVKNNIKYYFIAFQNFRFLRFYNSEIGEIRNELGKSGIHLITIPCFTFFSRFINWFSAQWFIIPLIFIFSFPVLLFLVLLKKITILHCRSYPIMIAAVAIKKIQNKIKIIFDPRSPFPEENATANRWPGESFSYKVWKRLEKIFLKYADTTITITETYAKHYKKNYPLLSYKNIPNNVDVEKFKPEGEARNIIRKYLDIKPDTLIFTYEGSLGIHWNNPNIYAKFVIELRKLNIDHNFLFLTPNNKILKDIFDKYGISTNEYYNINLEYDLVPKYLSVADFGINLMERKDIRLSIKTCEYLSMGLPIITNKKVLGAKEIVKKYKVGLVVDNVENIDLKEIEQLNNNRKNISLKCQKLAIEVFSNDTISDSYMELYKSLF